MWAAGSKMSFLLTIKAFHIFGVSFSLLLIGALSGFCQQSIILCPGFPHQGCSQEFSFTEARLKGKGALNAGGRSPPEADAIYQSHF